MPPNYVELELQIVPFLAATGYKLFGVHEIFGRLISLGFGLATVAVVGAFAQRLFRSLLAGVAAATLFAVYPGSMYYSRTFMPDTTMVFFLTAAVYASYRWLCDEDPRSWRGFALASSLTAVALLAKPVAIVGLVPIAVVSLVRLGRRATLTRPQTYAFAAVALLPLAVYDKIVSSHAEWHWASQITSKHVIPSLAGAATNPHLFALKALAFVHAIRMLATTMLGPFGIALLVLGFCIRYRRSEAALLWGWLAGAIAYAYVVVTVEKVDYYLYPVLPLAALVGGNLIARLWLAARSQRYWQAAPIVAIILLGAMIVTDRRIIAPYYRYSAQTYRMAKALDHELPPGALIVMAHYDPSILYTIGRKGWEEDPYLWTPFDEQSAIRKGSRYFIAVENNRFRRNVELYAWMQRFPVLNPAEKWPLYETDDAKILPGAEARWREFRRREKAGLLPKSSGPRVPASNAL